jgi:hypothetical protein
MMTLADTCRPVGSQVITIDLYGHHRLHRFQRTKWALQTTNGGVILFLLFPQVSKATLRLYDSGEKQYNLK